MKFFGLALVLYFLLKLIFISEGSGTNRKKLVHSVERLKIDTEESDLESKVQNIKKATIGSESRIKLKQEANNLIVENSGKKTSLSIFLAERFSENAGLEDMTLVSVLKVFEK